MNISVIIPVYNVEKYVERCLLSIMNQTYTESVECIVVNDCTPDDSMKIVENLVADYKGSIQFKLLSHEHNRGLAAVRNTGMEAATGDYIIHIDSDDYCELDMLEKMYAKAIEEDADIVGADYWISYTNHDVYHKTCLPNNFIDRLRCHLAGSRPSICYNVGLLIKRTLFLENNLKYIEGVDHGEDTIMLSFLYYYASKVAHLPFAFVHYVQYNLSSYTKSKSLKSLKDLIEGEKIILFFLQEKNLSDKLHREILGFRIGHMRTIFSNSKGDIRKKMLSNYEDITFCKIFLHFISCKILRVYNLCKSGFNC